MDAVVCESKVDGVHRLRVTLADGSQSERMITLHPWNHAPRELMSAAIESCSAGHGRRMRAQHASIVDMLSGQRLDVLKQCVTIDVAGDAADLAGVKDVGGLSAWLHKRHQQRCQGTEATAPTAVLLTGPPAAGKVSGSHGQTLVTPK